MTDIDRNRELVRNSAKCLLCGDEIESQHRHDPGITWVDTSIFVADQE